MKYKQSHFTVIFHSQKLKKTLFKTRKIFQRVYFPMAVHYITIKIIYFRILSKGATYKNMEKTNIKGYTEYTHTHNFL